MFDSELQNHPLHQAVIQGNVERVNRLKDSSFRFDYDKHGFNPIELAQLLGQRECQEVLLDAPPKTIKIQFEDQKFPVAYSLSEFEKMFKIIYRPFLTFPSYRMLQEVIRNCPYLFRWEHLISQNDAWENSYQEQLSLGATADTFIKWINPIIGYGVFADADIPEKSFIGEYTGIVRRIYRKYPDMNEYCFHYPTRFWSWNYFVIDALREGNSSRFINHSDQANLQPLWLVNRGLLHLIFISNRLISKGTELTFNYGSDYWKHRQKYNN